MIANADRVHRADLVRTVSATRQSYDNRCVCLEQLAVVGTPQEYR